MTDRPLEGRTAVITGAGRGLGKAMAEGLAAQGARIALVDVENEVLAAAVADVEAAGGQGCALAVPADVTDTANVNSAGAFMHTDIPDSDTGFVKRTGSETYDIDTSTYDPEGTGVAMSIALG